MGNLHSRKAKRGMDDVKLALLGNQEAARRLTETGYFQAYGDLRLEKCPFCGSAEVVYEKYLHPAGYRWRVVCMECMASIDPGHAQQRSTVQRMWNTRAPVLGAEEMETLEGTET